MVKYRQICVEQDSEVAINGKGKNVIPPPEKKPLWKGFLEKFKDPLIIVLFVVFFFSILVSCYEVYNGASYSSFIEPIGILVALLLATGVGFWFEVSAAKEFDVLNQIKNKRKVKVVRKFGDRLKTVFIPKHDVVVGDIVKLEGGDEIPADGILLESNNLRVDESNFTGEIYASKNIEGRNGDETPAYPTNMLLRSSTVIEGTAVMQVTKIGRNTEEGHGVQLANEESEVKTPLNQQLDKLGKYISIGSFVIAGLIVLGRLAYYYFLILPETGFEWLSFFELLLNSIMIAVALIVVAVPEGLPMSVTVSLALSMRKMLKENNLVRKLHACETMGAATVICTDKTGTLTENKMQVMDCQLFGNTDNALLARAIAINSTATIQTSENGAMQTIGNPTEGALLKWIINQGYDYEAIRDDVDIKQVVPFSTDIKYMKTILKNGECFVKGAPEVILDMCSILPANVNCYNLQNLFSQYQQKGMRTIAFAYNKQDEPLEFLGFAAIADPVREDVPEAIRICSQQSGVRIIMVTGDNALTAEYIAREVGLIKDCEEVLSLTGEEFAAMGNQELMELLKPEQGFKILSRARPNDKSRLVELLQRNGEVVAVTGDGTNDAPALRKAQVGLSMGDGTSRAKEASDITIINNSFASINTAILWGRSLYLNIKRFILFQMTINVAACFIVLYGAFMGLDSPLNVTQMLWVNLIMDTFAAMALSSLPADPRVMYDKPRKVNSQIVDSGMIWRIIVVGLAFCFILVGLWQLLSHGTYNDVNSILHDADLKHLLDFSKATHVKDSHELGIFFTFFVMLQFWNILNARYFKTDRSLIMDLWEIVRAPSSLSKHYSSGFGLVILLIFVGQIVIVNCCGEMFGVAPLDIVDWGWISLLTSIVLVVGELYRNLSLLLNHRKN